MANFSKHSRTQNSNRSSYCILEPRQLLAGIVFNAEIGQVLIGGTAGDDSATVTQSDDQITVTQEGFGSRDFSIAEVSFLHFVGLAGDDFFENQTSIPSRAYGQGGADTFIGGSGDDRLIGNDGDDTLQANGGNDFLFAGNGDDQLFGGDGADRILGTTGSNRIEGNAGNDTIYGGREDDVILGGDGDDFLSGGLGDDRILGNDGSDRIHAGEGDDRAFGHDGDDFLYGFHGNDRLEGGAGADVLAGNDGDDLLIGDIGSDRVVGGAGTDQSYYASNAEEYRVEGRGSYRVTDLRGEANNGTDTIFSVEEFNFWDGIETPSDLVRAPLPSATEVVYIQPVLVADTDGRNKTVFFGSPAQELDIKDRIDEIFAQAGVDVEFLTNSHWGDSFINFGADSRTGFGLNGERPEDHLDQIVDRGNSTGFGNRDDDVLDVYFVDRVPGFEFVESYVANGLAFVGANGVAMHIGENLVTSASGREIIAEVFAHEIAHNLGLFHHDDGDNLLSADGSEHELTDLQISTIIESQFTQLV